MKIIPVIMSGGSGTRLWPMSRAKYPKQFAELLDKPLQTLTIERLQNFGQTLIVTTEKLKDLTEKDIVQNKLKVEKVIYEPEGKNTAAAIALICKYLLSTGREEEVVGVFPSDSFISNRDEFEKALTTAVESAQKEVIVTLGIKPRAPETGFGYIQVKAGAVNAQRATEVLKFHEKPTLEIAKSFVADGHYFWNAGIFIFKVKTMISLFQQFEPDISIDYAIIEKLSPAQLCCVPCDMGWSDVGTWDALVEVTENAPFDKESLKKQPVQLAANGISVFSKQNKKYSVVGCDDLIVVDTADALLICKKHESQKVKELVDILKTTDEKITKEHVFENRPWGRYEILRDESYFKSKIILVEPGQKLSYQSHEKRAEHWVVVRGEAVVTLNDKEHVLKQGDNIFIPTGAKHRVHNRTNSVLEFIEVQVGTYFGEDDIKRYQDDYGRK